MVGRNLTFQLDDFQLLEIDAEHFQHMRIENNNKLGQHSIKNIFHRSADKTPNQRNKYR